MLSSLIYRTAYSIPWNSCKRYVARYTVSMAFSRSRFNFIIVLLQEALNGPENLRTMIVLIFLQLLSFSKLACEAPTYGKVPTKHISQVRGVSVSTSASPACPLSNGYRLVSLTLPGGLGDHELRSFWRESSVDGGDVVPKDSPRNGGDRWAGFNAHNRSFARAFVDEVRLSIADYLEISCHQFARCSAYRSAPG